MNSQLTHRNLFAKLKGRLKVLFGCCIIACILSLLLVLPRSTRDDVLVSLWGDDIDRITSQVSSSPDLAESQSNITNPHNFSLLINEPSACQQQVNRPLALVFVITGPENFRRRMHIRETWGHSTIQDQLQFRLLFALGRSLDDEINQEIEIESDVYRDIVQEDFIDSYRNLSYKSIMILKWAIIFCNFVPFILKIDDDTFLNIYNYIQSVKQIHDNLTEEARRRTFICLNFWWRTVARQGKWAVTVDEFSGGLYPEFCQGPAYTVPIELARRVYVASLTTRLFVNEDVYTTGILREKLNATILDLKAKYEMNIANYDERIVRGDAIFPYPHTTGFTPRVRYDLWKKIFAKNQASV